MSRTEFHGEEGYEGDPDIFIPRKIGTSLRKPLFSLQVDEKAGTVKITAAHTVTEIDEAHLEAVIESLQEAQDFLSSHTHRTS